MASLPPKQFNVALKKISTKVPDVALAYQKEVSLFALDRIVKSTPVDTGLARANWQLRRTVAETVVQEVDPAGTRAIVTGTAALKAIKAAFGTIWIFNNLDYIVRLEEGSSQQAPAGMVAANIPAIERFGDVLGRSRKFNRFLR